MPGTGRGSPASPPSSLHARDPGVDVVDVEVQTHAPPCSRRGCCRSPRLSVSLSRVMWYSTGPGYASYCQPKSPPQNSRALAVSLGRDLDVNHLTCHVSPLSRGRMRVAQPRFTRMTNETAANSTTHRQQLAEGDYGAEGARTPDLLAASQTLSQLSYGPRSVVSLAPTRGRERQAVAASSSTDGTSLHSSSSR